MNQQKDSFFSSRLGMILSVLGIAVGTGNIWRFPRIVANNGGAEGAGAFIFAWICCLFLFSIPLIITEYGMGRHGRKGVIGSFIALVGKRYAWMGSFIAFVASAIMFYYSVVAGWCLYYFVTSLGSALPSSLSQSQAVWNGFQHSMLPVVFHGMMMALGALIVVKGISSIERINKVLIPSLLLVVIISLIRAIMLPGSFQGISYLFTPDWSTLSNPTIWIEALTQNAWDTGAAWGLILTYAAYMRNRDDITISAFQTGIGNNLVSLLAAITIFSTVFGTLGSSMSDTHILSIMKDSGPAGTGLTFMWMPQLFARMPGGRLFAVLFFLGLTFAAFSSLISMIELASRVLVDMDISRKAAVVGVCTTGFLLGLPSALSTNFLVNQDTVWGIGLLVSGAFMAYAVIRFSPSRFRSDLINTSSETYQLGKWWEIIIQYVVPIEVVTLLGWWIFQSAAVNRWYDPFSTFSLATVVLQWGLAMGLFWFYNRKIADKSSGD